jgi:hypothetical protein
MRLMVGRAVPRALPTAGNKFILISTMQLEWERARLGRSSVRPAPNNKACGHTKR